MHSPVALTPEVIGETGIPMVARSVEDCDATIRQLHDSPQLRQSYIEAGRARVQCFTWQRCAARLLAALRSV